MPEPETASAAPAPGPELPPESAASDLADTPDDTPADPSVAAAGEPAAPAPGELSPAATGARLAELFPALFGARPLPIKLRIQADIQQRAPGVFTKKGLSLFLHRHTTSTAYLKSLVANTQRFDLDGQPAGELAPEHKDAAAAEVERRRGIVKERIAAEREKQREAQREQFKAQRQAEREAQAAARQQRQQHDREFEARRERAQLLRAFETTTLARANFRALKGLADAQLEEQLALARQERAERPPRPEHAGPAERPRRDPPRRPR